MATTLDKHAANGAVNSKLLTEGKHAEVAVELLDGWDGMLPSKERNWTILRTSL